MPPVMSDEQLLTSGDPEAFGTFYARYRSPIERYFAARLDDRETAADLAADTFASALLARRHFVAGATPAAGWLYTIAARRLVDHRRRTAVDRRRHESVAATIAVSGEASAEPELDAPVATALLDELPDEQRQAVRAHVLGERGYDELADALRTSEAAVRQRVSRGLRCLRSPLLVYRAAQEVAREDRAYRFAGGHEQPLLTLTRREPLDCSSSASLVLARSGVFADDRAWTSGRLATDWGRPGEGRHVTVWANEEHVWIEFRLDPDHGERFDPTPSRRAPNSGWMTRANAARPRDGAPRHWPGL